MLYASKTCGFGNDPHSWLASILTGIAFSRESHSNGGISLLMTTDKHVISLPLMEVASGPRMTSADANDNSYDINTRSCTTTVVPSWEDISMRRMEFGLAESMIRDENSGLLFLAARPPPSSHRGGTRPLARLRRPLGAA